LVSIGLVLSEEKIFEKVYDVRRRWTPSDGNSSVPKSKSKIVDTETKLTTCSLSWLGIDT
jgi:hypothetical protein